MPWNIGLVGQVDLCFETFDRLTICPLEYCVGYFVPWNIEQANLCLETLGRLTCVLEYWAGKLVLLEHWVG